MSARAALKDPVKRRPLADQQSAVCADYARKFIAPAALAPGEAAAVECSPMRPWLSLAGWRWKSHWKGCDAIAHPIPRSESSAESSASLPVQRSNRSCAVLIRNPDHTAKGHACLALAKMLAFAPSSRVSRRGSGDGHGP